MSVPPEPPEPPVLPPPPSPTTGGAPRRRAWFRFGPPDRARGATSVAWLAVGGLLAVGSLIWGSLQALGAISHDERPVRDVVPAAEVERVVVRSDMGRVDLVVGDDDEVVIDAKVRDGLVATTYDVTVVDGEVRVSVGCSWATGPWCKADLRIAVPADLAVDVRTDTGRITATELAGELRLASDIGTIRGTGLRASDVDATSGASEVRLAFAVAPATVRAVADTGRVEVAVPDDEAYRVDAVSDSGSVAVEVRTDPEAERTIEARSGASDVLVRYLERAAG